MPAIGSRRGGPAMRKKKIGIADTELRPELLDSDEDDGDYDEKAERATTTSPRKRVASKGRKAPKKRRNKNTYSDDDEISDSELDDLQIDNSSMGSESEAKETDEEENLPRTRTRRKQASYKEPDSDEDLELTPGSESEREIGKNNKKGLVEEKLSEISTQPERRTTRASSRAASRAASIGPSLTQIPATTARKNSRAARQTSVGPVRKSSRLHPETPEPVQHLASDGKHAVVDEPKHPSTVFEESEETSLSQPQVKSEAVPETVIRGTEEPEDAPMPGTDEPDNNDDDDDAPSAQAPEVEPEVVAASEEDDDEEDIQRPRRGLKRTAPNLTSPPAIGSPLGRATRRNTRLVQKKSPTKKGVNDTDDEFAPDDAASGSDESEDSEPKAAQSEPEDDSERPSRSTRRSPNKRSISDHDEQEELEEELMELRSSKGRKRQRTSAHVDTSGPTLRQRKSGVNYQIGIPLDFAAQEELFNQSQQDNRGLENKFKGRSLFSTAGPFGGNDGRIAPILGDTRVNAMGYAGGADSDSSDDERPVGLGASPIMARGALKTGGLAHGGQGADQLGNPVNLGRVKQKEQLTTDSDPLGVDKNINFDSVGGLDEHINQLKDMVLLPLLYPEVFQKFGTTPPRGVLFHGPPGTGKTLLARALANDCFVGDQKITFFMRKGADVMSKWVGEAERQLRVLFEEAKKNQPSIIFFDEIDGLAPVRSSKQEQIHASIVATLLALMDGMDGRGQIIVIGATNRPDSVDPALRRPGRFDREFYFPLPNREARRSIIDINTRHWDPPLPDKVKDQLAEFTKGYGGADLRALCTEAALNAIQRRYPQIYKSKEKLQIDINTIHVTPRDFMLAQKKIIPSSERATSSAGSPLPEHVQPLLESTVGRIKALIEEILPRRKYLTVLEEAEYEDDVDPDSGFDREMRMREFDSGRIFRPRLLIHGAMGMGQTYIGPAILHHFEGFHVQSLDLASIYSDSSVNPEVTLINKFTEIKRHKPSVIFIPNIDMFFTNTPDHIQAIFDGLVNSIPANDPILLLGVMEGDIDTIPVADNLKRGFFCFSKRNIFKLEKPDQDSRFRFFERVIEQFRMAPKDFPDLTNRKKRKLEDLPKAPPPPPKVLSDEELRNWKAKDRETLHWLIFRLKPSVEGSSTRMRKLRKGVVDQSAYPDVFAGEPKEDSPYELITENGETKVLERATSKKFYNISLITIEDRIINGYYKTPDAFLEDCKRLRRDARVLGEDRDRERWLKANEFFGNAEILVSDLKNTMPAFIVDCENMAMRERIRQERRIEKQEQLKAIEAPKTGDANENEGDKSGESHQTNGVADEGNQIIDVGEVTVLDETQTDLTNGPRGQSSPRPTSASQPIEVAHRLADISGLTGLGSFTSQASQAEVSQVEISQVERVEVSRVEEVPASQPDRSHSSATKSTQSTSQADSMKANAGSNDESTGPSGESQSQTYQASQFQAILLQKPKARSQESLIAKQGSQQMTTQSTESLFEIAARKRTTTGNPLNDSQGSQDLPSGDTGQLRKSMESNASVNQNSSGNTASNGTERDHSDNPNDKSQLDFSNFLNSSGDSQVPETQSNSSSQDAASLAQLLSSPPGPLVTSVAAERRMLTLQSGHSGNSASNSQVTTQPPQSQEHEFQTPAVPQQRLKMDEDLFTRIREDLTERTDGFSVENLEQVMATVMSTVWRYRNDWDRTHVAKEVFSVANEAINDIKEMEKSMNSQQSG